MGQAVSDAPEQKAAEQRSMTNRPNWQQNVDRLHAEANRLVEQSQALLQSPKREDAERALAIRHRASELAQQATQIESYYLHGEVYMIRK